MRITTKFFVLGLASMLIAGTCYAEAALQDCLTDFDTAIQAFKGETDGGARDVVRCTRDRGLVQLYGLGTVPTEDYRRTFVAQLQTRDNSQIRRCVIDLGRQEIPKDLNFSHLISAKDAAAWNRFLNGPGCQQLMALFP